jgi:hypothetical protein
VDGSLVCFIDNYNRILRKIRIQQCLPINTSKKCLSTLIRKIVLTNQEKRDIFETTSATSKHATILNLINSREDDVSHPPSNTVDLNFFI